MDEYSKGPKEPKQIIDRPIYVRPPRSTGGLVSCVDMYPMSSGGLNSCLPEVRIPPTIRIPKPTKEERERIEADRALTKFGKFSKLPYDV